MMYILQYLMMYDHILEIINYKFSLLIYVTEQSKAKEQDRKNAGETTSRNWGKLQIDRST